MDDLRVGRIVRVLRHRRGWRQADLAAAAGCSQNAVSMVERGHLDRLSLGRLRRILGAVDAMFMGEVRWRGAALDRLLDEGHASVVAMVAEYLRSLGWRVEIEVTYSEYGERGSFDLLAMHGAAGILLVIEVKTDLPSAEAMLRKLDEKVRHAPKVARERFSWTAAVVARLIVMPSTMTLRRRVARHDALFDPALPVRTVAVRRWLAKPVGRLAGIWFLSDRDGGVGIRKAAPRERIRRPKSVVSNRGIATRDESGLRSASVGK